MRPEIQNMLRPHYREIEGYVSAGMEAQKTDELVFLNANENPFELPGLEGLARYPEPQPKALAAAYAETYGVEHTQVVMTRGADEAIAILTKLFCEPHKDAVLISSPTFGMYGVNAHAMPAQELVDVPLIAQDGSFTLDKDGIIAAAQDPDKHVKLVYICSPNNPTGTLFSQETISEICEALEGHAVVVLDETYAEFSPAGSMCDDLDSTPNLIILRTLSKSYALAGMRMGCFLCGDEDFIALARVKAMDAYPLPQISIEAAFHVLSPEVKAQAHENIQKLIAERERMEEAYKKAKDVIHVYPSVANFLLVKMERASAFNTYCAEHGYVLRDFSNKAGTEGCLRISIGTPEQNDKILELLESFSKS